MYRAAVRVRRNSVLVWIRLVLVVISFVATGFLAIAKSISPQPPVPVIVLVTIGLVLVGALLPALGDFRFGRAVAVERGVSEALRGAFAHMLTLSFPPTDLRLHFFRVGRVWRKPWPAWQGALIRVGYFALKTSAPLGDIVWTKGKGLIGQVWENPIPLDGRAEDVRIPSVANEQAWKGQPDAVTRKLTWGEAQKAKHVDAVLAVPVLRSGVSGDVVGVISADTPIGLLPELQKDAVKTFLGVTGTLAWRTVLLRGRSK